MPIRNLYLTAIVTIAIGLLFGCSVDNATTQTEQTNKALIIEALEAMNNHEYARYSEFFAPGFRRHSQASPDVEVTSLDDMIEFVKTWDQAFPDARMELRKIAADGDVVAVWGTYAGTHKAPMGEIPATGKRMESETFGFFRIEEGKIAESWVTWDNVAVLKQLGLFPVSSSEQPGEANDGGIAMEYYRLYADEAGNSHFETRDIEFSSVDFAPPAPPLEIASLGPAESCFLLKGSPGWYGDWHPAPFRQLHFYLSGEIEVETSDGRIGRVGPGDVVLVEDTSGQGHKSRVIGSTEAVIAAVRLAGDVQAPVKRAADK